MTPAGYLSSPWPAEDGGPERLQTPHATPGLKLAPGERLQCVTRRTLMSTMTVLGAPGEVYLLTHSALRSRIGGGHGGEGDAANHGKGRGFHRLRVGAGLISGLGSGCASGFGRDTRSCWRLSMVAPRSLESSSNWRIECERMAPTVAVWR